MASMKFIMRKLEAVAHEQSVLYPIANILTIFFICMIYLAVALTRGPKNH